MSVFTFLALDCNGPGCHTRFLPPLSDGVSLAPKLRGLAEDAGWTVQASNTKGEDYCPACSLGLRRAHKLERGICAHCGAERPLTMRAVVVLHDDPTRDAYGRQRRCDGGGRPPARLILPKQRTSATVNDVSTTNQRKGA